MSTSLQLTTELARTPAPVLILRFMGLELEALLRRCARALGVNHPRALPLAELTIPDSAYCRAATALAQKLESPMLFNHSMRTYLFGTAVGRHIGLRPDPELLYLSAILHDLGLVPEHDHPESFELNGARAAHDFLRREGLDEERAARVHEAIALHSAVGIAGSGTPELALVHFGAGLDVIGFHAEDVAPQTRDAIVTRWPRHQFKQEFEKLLVDQAQRKPACHIAGHVRLGFSRKIAAAPFAE
jgi:cyanamide hydratase family protein with HD domain